MTRILDFLITVAAILTCACARTLAVRMRERAAFAEVALATQVMSRAYQELLSME